VSHSCNHGLTTDDIICCHFTVNRHSLKNIWVWIPGCNRISGERGTQTSG